MALAVTPLVLATTVASAADDTTFGDTTAPGSPCDPSETVLQVASSGPGYSAPTDGVITKVQIAGDVARSSALAFKLARRVGSSDYAIVGSATLTPATTGQTLTQKVRIPARAGDVIGFSHSDSGADCVRFTGQMTDAIRFIPGDPAAGTAPAGSTGMFYRLAVAATLEPDADGDGYGDSTQDGCPTQAGAHGLCDLFLGSPGQPGGRAKVGRLLSAPAVSVPAGATKSYQWYRQVTVRRTRGGARSSGPFRARVVRRTSCGARTGVRRYWSRSRSPTPGTPPPR